jgi:hypothetical protein
MTNTDWRDLTAELTSTQIASMEYAEAQAGEHAGRPDIRQKLLDLARLSADLNVADATYANIPAPPAAEVGGWERNTAGGFSRSLEWGDVATGVDGVDIAIDGRQEHTGDFNRGVTMYIDGSACLNAEEARRVAAALVTAADEFDRQTGAPPRFFCVPIWPGAPPPTRGGGRRRLGHLGRAQHHRVPVRHRTRRGVLNLR